MIFVLFRSTQNCTLKSIALTKLRGNFMLCERACERQREAKTGTERKGDVEREKSKDRQRKRVESETK